MNYFDESEQMDALFTYRKKVEFSETDMAGIVHFANFFRWMEVAEAELFDSLGATLIEHKGGITAGWPRVRVNCEFHAPLHFRDEVEIQLTVKAVKIRAVEYAFRFYRLGGDVPVHVATGAMTTVFACRKAETGVIESAELEPELAQALEKLVQ
ncbi:acyl-CoA thioesterase [Cerasicoccus arenae]|uniref:4-hydroxybenzoyl-CoA thioesterase n=1 Tax=Cerasicoccus arenae TaxID=424488 RepID=A0A8J3D9X5_9BACT|nr:thioesterase family protein [Cerasicoccus arenae]MBK1859688.1 acyl-CoA thioesterase [Cerasicoccus arenae]GHB93047.1 4-hydroxybenzoyl-CoA thioesterase [Cerasicoccus arenae]